MNVGIVGLGLIGGSMARAFSKAGHTVYAEDCDESIFEFACLAGAVNDRLDSKTACECDLILLAVYPEACIQWAQRNAPMIRKDALVMDLCGTKETVCNACFGLAQEYGFIFAGGHPMAGSHHSGFKYSRSNLFQGAPMVIVPPRFDDMQLLDRIKSALAPCNFGFFSVCNAKEHDKMIAFTSQMPHVLSNAYIKSPTASQHKGFSAGSYRDLTRVAWLQPQMWAQLCVDNKENVLFELDTYIENLRNYQQALKDEDMQTLVALFEEGRRRKEEVDG